MSEAQADSQVMRSVSLSKKTTPHTDLALADPQRHDNRALAIGTPVIHKGHSFRQLEGQICKVLHKVQLGIPSSQLRSAVRRGYSHRETCSKCGPGIP